MTREFTLFMADKVTTWIVCRMLSGAATPTQEQVWQYDVRLPVQECAAELGWPFDCLSRSDVKIIAAVVIESRHALIHGRETA